MRNYRCNKLSCVNAPLDRLLKMADCVWSVYVYYITWNWTMWLQLQLYREFMSMFEFSCQNSRKQTSFKTHTRARARTHAYIHTRTHKNEQSNNTKQHKNETKHIQPPQKKKTLTKNNKQTTN